MLGPNPNTLTLPHLIAAANKLYMCDSNLEFGTLPAQQPTFHLRNLRSHLPAKRNAPCISYFERYL